MALQLTKSRKLIILGGLGVVALGAVSLVLLGRGSSSSTPSASRAPASTPAVKGGAAPQTTAPKVPAKQVQDVFQRKQYTYRSLGRVDPFRSLIQPGGDAERAFSEKLDPEMIKLVGVLVKEGERRALIEDVNGYGYILKEGDRVLRGKVIRIEDETLKIRHTLYGVTETMTLNLVRNDEGGSPHAKLR